jgi:uncharacterized membrane protein
MNFSQVRIRPQWDYKLLIIFSVIFLVLDMSWITIFSKIFNPMIENIQKSPVKINYIGAILAYVVMLISYYNLVYDGNVPNYYKAALLGFAIYGTYEFTNLATITGWDNKILIIDIIWGIFVSVFSLFLTDMIYKRL